MDVVKQVAEAKCLECDGEPHGYRPLLDCAECDLTGLRWPTLSRRKCYWAAQNGECPICHKEHVDNIRVPDVTLEKVCGVIFDAGFQLSLCRMDDGQIRADLYGHRDGNLLMFDEYRMYADTPLEAACAALIQSVAKSAPVDYLADV